MNQLATPPPSLRRRLARPLAALGLLLATAGAAQAQTPTNFTYTAPGSSQTYTVPAGITRLSVVATGAAGGGNRGNNRGGLGAVVQATITVVPGEVLTVVVGGLGGEGNNGSAAAGGAGGYNGGGNGSYTGGGGGGATDLRRAATNGSTGDYLTSRNALLVAGGGGGGDASIGNSNGGNGGTPNGGNGGSGQGGQAGQGATTTALGGGYPGSNGTGGNGNPGNFNAAGGGGYYGGGGGNGGPGGGVNGGGGGSSYVLPTGSSNVSYGLTTGRANGSLAITPLPTPALTNLSPTSGMVGSSVTLTGTNLAGATGVSFNGTAATTFAVVNATTVMATVPTGATTGPIQITTGNGVATSTTDFTVRRAPVANSDSYTTASNTTLIVTTGRGVLTNDIADPGTYLQAQLVTSPAYGKLQLNPDGSFTYAPNAGFSGSDSFTYRACDNGSPSLCSNVATVTINVLTAPATAPAVSTAAASNVGPTSATLGGTVSSDGGSAVTQRGVVYSSSNSTPTLGGSNVAAATASGSTGSFTVSVTGLTPSTTYYARAYASNSVGTSYGSVVSLTTLAPPATAAPVLTSPASGSTTNSTPTFAGTAPAGSTVTIYLAIGSGAAQAIGTTTAPNGSFSLVPATALASGSYAAYAAAQSSGSSVSANSNTNSFTVDATAPAVTLSSPNGASGSSTPSTPLSFTATFSKPVTGFAASGLMVSNGSVTSGPTGSGSSYTFQVTPATPGMATTVTVAAGATQDAVGNPSTASAPYSLTYQVPASVRVQYQTGDLGQPLDMQIRPYLQLVNTGATPVPYQSLTVRYWLTVEDFAPVVTNIDYARLGTGLVSARYVALDPQQPRQGAYGYVEYSFAAGAGSLAPGANSGPIYGKIYKQNWSAFDETDDWSYQPSGSFTTNDHLTLYQNGQLIAGTEPPAATPVQNALQVLASYQNAAMSQDVNVYLQVYNTGNTPVSYADLKLRYYLTSENGRPVVASVLYAKQPGAGNVNVRVVQLPAPVGGANSYLEFTFAASLGSLAPRSNTGNIQFKFRRDDYGPSDQANDYSYGGTMAFAVQSHIPAYVANRLVFGTPPAGAPARVAAGLVAAAPAAPLAVSLTGSPNPFTDQLTLQFSLAHTQAYSLVVLDGLGRVVRQLPSGTAEAGQPQQLTLPGSELATGLYIVRLTTATDQQQFKFMKQ